ncbi:MAG: ROK family transcriptional regulator [Aquisalimonadaceae bacterium]
MESSSGASSEGLRRHNRSLVLQHIFTNGPTSRVKIAAKTGLTGAAITRITRELIDAGLIREGAKVGNADRPGRRSIELDLDETGGYVLGFGAGAFEQWIQLSGLRGQPIARQRLKLMGARSAAAALATVVEAGRDLIRRSGVEYRRVLGLGAAIAGVVDPRAGTVLLSPNLGWRDVELGQILASGLGMPVRVESLHHALNLTESQLGKTRGLNDVVLINLALGIGASILADGRIIRASSTMAGQIGHMRMPGASELCTCGRRGCLDTVSSGYAVLRALGRIEPRHEAGRHKPSNADIMLQAIAEADAGEPEVVGAFLEAGKHLGSVLDAVWALNNPKRVVLAGPLAQVRSYVEGVRLAIDRERWQSKADEILVISDKSNDAAGAWLALDEFMLRQDIRIPRPSPTHVPA